MKPATLVLSLCFLPPIGADASAAKGPGRVVLGASLEAVKASSSSVACSPSATDDSNTECVDIVPEYPIGGMAAFVKYDVRKSPEPGGKVERITVRFHPSWGPVFLQAAKRGENFGPTYDHVAEVGDKTLCRDPDKLPEYIHAIWKKGAETVEFWSYRGRVCTAQLVFR